MNSFVKISCIFIILTSISLSQEISDSLKVNNQTIQPNKNFSFLFDGLDFYLDLQNLNKTFLLNSDPNTRWLWTSYAISNSKDESFQSEINFNEMTHPLYQKYIEDSKFNPFRYALGMAQVSAVGYLAYRHIKKYGFLKE